MVSRMTGRVLVALAGLLFAVTALHAAGALVFVSDRDGSRDIYTVNSDGTALKRHATVARLRKEPPGGGPGDLTFTNPLRLGPYLLLALFMTLLAALYTHTFYRCKECFDRLPIRKHFRPAIGAFLTGLIAFALYFLLGRNTQVLAVLAFGYSALQNAMTQDTAATAGILLTIAFGKILTTGLTIGSGGSGGVPRPPMVIGGCGGGALGVVLHHWWPWLVPHPASFVIVGMAGFFAAAAKTPFSTLIIVSEMTGGYHLLLPSLWVCTLSFILSDKQSIYSSQVESRSLSPAHQGSNVRKVLAEVRVSQFLSPGQSITTLAAQDSLAKVIDRLSGVPYSVLPVVDANNRL